MPLAYETITIPDAATYTVQAYNTGMVHYIPDLTADIVISLPTADQGLWFEFVYAGVAADAQDRQLNTGSNTNYFIGGLLYVDDAPAADSIGPDGNSNSKCNVLVPEPVRAFGWNAPTASIGASAASSLPPVRRRSPTSNRAAGQKREGWPTGWPLSHGEPDG